MTPIPARLILDSSVAIDWLTATTAVAAPLTPAQHRAIVLVRHVQISHGVGLITPTSLNEIFHVVVKTGYRAELPNFRADLVSRYPDVKRHGWEHLFKTRPNLMKRFAADLDRIRQFMAASNLLFLQPDDLGEIPSGRSLEEEIIQTMGQFELDSSDTAILVEARRAGITTIATADPDLRRAHADFDVYTWL
jgi:predicted nucleic acid-binding protein